MRNATENHLIDVILARLGVPLQVIAGCSPIPLLSRWKLFVGTRFQVYLHKFHRSDEDRELHNHPFHFVSLILWGGYVEVRPKAEYRTRLRAGDERLNLDDPAVQERKRYYPGQILVRPAWWAHRVEIPAGKPSWSLVLRTPKLRDWGFFTAAGLQHWRLFTNARICED